MSLAESSRGAGLPWGEILPVGGLAAATVLLASVLVLSGDTPVVHPWEEPMFNNVDDPTDVPKDDEISPEEAERIRDKIESDGGEKGAVIIVVADGEVVDGIREVEETGTTRDETGAVTDAYAKANEYPGRTVIFTTRDGNNYTTVDPSTMQ